MRYLLVSLLLLASCSRETEPVSWEGLDNGTAFHLCANSAPQLSGTKETVFSLIISPSFSTSWLMRVGIDDGAIFELLTQDDTADPNYLVKVSKPLSNLDVREFRSKIQETGILRVKPVDDSKISDGTSLLFEHVDNGKYLAFGSNDNQQLREIRKAFMTLCGEDCDYLWSIPHAPDYARPWEHCVPILKDGSGPLDEYRRRRVAVSKQPR